MNHAERVKEFIRQFLAYQISKAEMDAAIDAMQSALDDAVAERDKYMGLWAALSQDDGKAERAIAELEAKLAARDAEVERLRATLLGIAEADYRKWKELANADEFVRWAKSRAAHALSEEVKGGE